MKDLYTFDATTEQALQTYEAVRQAYSAFFKELRLPYLTAEASSGEIGGSLSHEYHFPSKKGEDKLVSCNSCNYVANEELAESRISQAHRSPNIRNDDIITTQKPDTYDYEYAQQYLTRGLLGLGREGSFDGHIESQAKDPNKQWFGISQDRSTLVQVVLPRETEVLAAAGKRYRMTEINPYAIKKIFTELDLGVENPLEAFKAKRAVTAEGKSLEEARILRFVDMRYSLRRPHSILPNISSILIEGVDIPIEDRFAEVDNMVDLVRIETGDPCPNCDEGSLKVESAVELGHTFHLGTRYSMPLEAMIDSDPSLKDSQRGTTSIPSQSVTLSDRIPVQMGCHGIGVSRLIAAVADSLVDSKGLNWPRVMAPFDAIIIPTKGSESEAPTVYDLLTTSNIQGPMDAILDDRDRNFGWKLKDADMIGYPVIVILGRDWKKERKCEVQCRRLGVKESVSADDIQSFVEQLLGQL